MPANAVTSKEITRYDFVSARPLIKFAIQRLRWKPMLSIGWMSGLLVNVAERDIFGTWGNRDLSYTNKVAQGFTVGLGIVSPQFHRFDFSFQVFYNHQVSQAGDIYKEIECCQGPGGGVFVPRTQTFDVFLTFAFHPFHD